MNEYYFRHMWYDIDGMLKSGQVEWMIFDGEFTLMKTDECCDEWFS